MDFTGIERLAAKGDPLPGRPRLEELSCYMALHGLYRGYYAKSISPNAARQRKQEIRRAYLEAVETHARQAAAWAQYQEFHRLGGKYLYQIREAVKARADPLSVAELCLRLYGALCGESICTQSIFIKNPSIFQFQYIPILTQPSRKFHTVFWNGKILV